MESPLAVRRPRRRLGACGGRPGGLAAAMPTSYKRAYV
jgi:hypothetical protein